MDGVEFINNCGTGTERLCETDNCINKYSSFNNSNHADDNKNVDNRDYLGNSKNNNGDDNRDR